MPGFGLIPFVRRPCRTGPVFAINGRQEVIPAGPAARAS